MSNANFPNIDNQIKITSVSTEYLPIISSSSPYTIFGYEASAKFWDNDYSYSTSDFFTQKISLQLLQKYEIYLKLLQIKCRPLQAPLFVNISKELLLNKKYMLFWNEFICKQDSVIPEMSWGDEDRAVFDFISFLGNKNIHFAYDNKLCNNLSMFSESFIKSPIVKVAGNILPKIKNDPSCLESLRSLSSFCKVNNKVLILKGVESIEDVEIGRAAGVEYLQGYYYRDLGIRTEPFDLPELAE